MPETPIDGPARLRGLLAGDAIIQAIGAADPMVAKLGARAGFEAVYMTGAGTALTRVGMPDVGLITMSEMVANAASIAAAVEVPVIADADTGYGNALNVRRTVREYERAGVAGIHLEDQVYPKKCGHLFGKQLIPVEEMEQKIRAACDARRDDAFVIIARCDAALGEGLDSALERAAAYARVGADLLFVESPTSIADMRRTAEADLGAPLLLNMASSGKTPFISAREAQDIGYRVMIFPNFALLATIKAVGEVFAEMRRTGSAAPVLDRCASFAEFMQLAGLDEVQELERLYGTPEHARTRI